MGNKQSLNVECETSQHLLNYKIDGSTDPRIIRPELFKHIKSTSINEETNIVTTTWKNALRSPKVSKDDHEVYENYFMKNCADAKNKIWKEDRGYEEEEHSYTIEQYLDRSKRQTQTPLPSPNGNVSDFSNYFYDSKINSNWRDRNNRKFIGRCHGKRETHPLLNGKFVMPFEVPKSDRNEMWGFDYMVTKMHLAEKNCFCKYHKMNETCKK